MTSAELDEAYAALAADAAGLRGPVGRDEVLAEARQHVALLEGRNMASRSNGKRSWNGGK